MSDFTEAVDRANAPFDPGGIYPGACPGCEECGLGDAEDMDDPAYEYANESFFSSRDCDCCGSSFGGDRSYAHATMDGELVHLSICVDCLMYLANGVEPEEWWRSPNDPAYLERLAEWRREEITRRVTGGHK